MLVLVGAVYCKYGLDKNKKIKKTISIGPIIIKTKILLNLLLYISMKIPITSFFFFEEKVNETLLLEKQTKQHPPNLVEVLLSTHRYYQIKLLV